MTRERCKECGDRLFKIVDGKIVCRKGHVHAVKAVAPNIQHSTAKPALETAGQKLEGQDVTIEVQKVPKRKLPSKP